MEERDAYGKALGAEILRIRTKHNVSRNALARVTGCAWNDVRAYEEGTMIPSAYRLQQICWALGVKRIEPKAATKS